MRLRDLGNSLIVVEHDEDTMRAADCVIDIGPGAGEHGGQLVAMGTAEDLMKKDHGSGQKLRYMWQDWNGEFFRSGTGRY